MREKRTLSFGTNAHATFITTKTNLSSSTSLIKFTSKRNVRGGLIHNEFVFRSQTRQAKLTRLVLGDDLVLEDENYIQQQRLATKTDKYATKTDKYSSRKHFIVPQNMNIDNSKNNTDWLSVFPDCF